MKTKHLFQVFVLLAILFSALGVGQPAQAQSAAVQIVMRDLTYWGSIYTGYVDATRYEKWPLNFAETHNFTVTVTPSSGALSPLILLLDANNNELARAVGTLTSEQPMGNYYVQIQPETTEGGTYSLTIREVVVILPTVSVAFDPITYDPPHFEVGETTTAIVSLSNVPTSGYPSVEFTCSYDTAFVTVANIANKTDLFGADAVSALNGPADGSFIFAIAGSNGNKAVADGAAFTFDVTGLQVGETLIDCRARVSDGSGVLTEINHTPGPLSIDEHPIVGWVDGTVIAPKIATVSLYDSEGNLVGSDETDENGYFNIQAPAGTYKIVAEVEGYLKAEGTVAVEVGKTKTMPTINLLAGDIDLNLAGDINGDGVIDQLDSLTIGMNYNKPTPTAADLNNDGNIDVLDLERLAANYRAVGPTPWQ